MNDKPIVLYKTDPRLKEISEFVSDFSTIPSLVNDLLKAMVHYNGIGISAPQLGVLKRVILISDGKGNVLPMVNPIVFDLVGSVSLEEGCLSFPGDFIERWRYRYCKVQYQDVDGNHHQVKLKGKLAHVAQHEVDHLDGRLLR